MGAGNSVVRHDMDVVNYLRDMWKASHLIPYDSKSVYTRPDGQFKTVRVFVSSTFKDYFAEREILVKTVFPRLREFCLQRRLLLVEVDLRWGVPQESSTDTILRVRLH